VRPTLLAAVFTNDARGMPLSLSDAGDHQYAQRSQFAPV
jgi:hypothetical protein